MFFQNKFQAYVRMFRNGILTRSWRRDSKQLQENCVIWMLAVSDTRLIYKQVKLRAQLIT
uniref:Uncharacterized protein n=1 Tax=Oryza brachyantha TaxID=4533 RepID=J3MW51_ORYBR